jgi:type I restriction enzyme M protein
MWVRVRPKSKGSEALDLGVVFLENAYRSLAEEGRLGIVLSNSIASINKWSKVREWLMDRMRIVALFDLPANVFAETGVNTSILIAYKPKPSALQRLNKDGYSIFVRDIQRIGYERRTSKQNVFFNPVFKINEQTFEIDVDAAGNPMLDEEFTETLLDFRKWSLGQEEALQKLFVRSNECVTFVSQLKSLMTMFCPKHFAFRLGAMFALSPQWLRLGLITRR